MADIELVIKIPEKEFGIDMDDKFQDFFKRLETEIKSNMISGTNLVCGSYELETIDMFLKAFNNSIPLPKGHGDLKDISKIDYQSGCFISSKGEPIPIIHKIATIEMIRDWLPTIIEADSEVEQ